MANEMFDLRVREVIANTLKIGLEEVVDTADVMDDLGADSLDVLDLIMVLEEEFDVAISDADVINNRIVEDIVQYIINAKENRGESLCFLFTNLYIYVIII